MRLDVWTEQGVGYQQPAVCYLPPSGRPHLVGHDDRGEWEEVGPVGVDHLGRDVQPPLVTHDGVTHCIGVRGR